MHREEVGWEPAAELWGEFPSLTRDVQGLFGRARDWFLKSF